jgi:hypothetical protein
MISIQLPDTNIIRPAVGFPRSRRNTPAMNPTTGMSRQITRSNPVSCATGKGCEPELFLVGKVKFRGPQPEELMQLVDMVCGASGACLDGEDTWYRIIAERDLSRPKQKGRVSCGAPRPSEIKLHKARRNRTLSEAGQFIVISRLGTAPARECNFTIGSGDHRVKGTRTDSLAYPCCAVFPED